MARGASIANTTAATPTSAPSVGTGHRVPTTPSAVAPTAHGQFMGAPGRDGVGRARAAAGGVLPSADVGVTRGTVVIRPARTSPPHSPARPTGALASDATRSAGA